MIKIIISWTYYKEDSIFSWFWRLKKQFVNFYDYDKYIEYIINQLSLSKLYKLKINMYNKYHKLVKFTRFTDIDNSGLKFEWYNLLSPIIDIDIDTFAQLLPDHSLRKKYFVWDSIRERYYLKSDFINWINLNV